MSVLSADMAFEIGDVVYFKTANNDLMREPRRFVVIERMLQQCPGGIQKHYVLAGNDMKNSTVNEIMLTKEMPPFDAAYSLERLLAEKRIKDAVEEATK